MNTETTLSIDAPLLQRAQRYYASHGFVDTPTPWLVSEAAYTATCPEEVIRTNKLWCSPLGTFHVASAEQGFIEMLLSGRPIPDRAQSTTPCFRWEEAFDHTHLPFFYKLELYDVDTSRAALVSMLGLARHLFAELGVQTRIEPMENNSFDIVSTQGLELGSYGVRHVEGHSWTYGTGIALPRFEQAKA